MLFWDQHKTLTDYYELLSEEVCDKYALTQMEYDILLFLHSDPRHNTAADIVAVRKSTKSHVSISLKSLESKGLISRKQDENNKKRIESPPIFEQLRPEIGSFYSYPGDCHTSDSVTGSQ